MSKDDVTATLHGNGHEIISESRLSNDTGWQLRLKGGQIVNVFDKGTIQVQGKNTDVVKELLGMATTPAGTENTVSGRSGGSAGARNVFVVYGHDEDAKTKLEAMLRRWGLNPLILDQLPSGGQTIIEKLEKLLKQRAL